ncbi:MAG: UbiD family decarboxylase [Desulfobacteraceae bacterium]|nr:UbiD family decarboxylase [Desulfobacteraceae bacterium]
MKFKSLKTCIDFLLMEKQAVRIRQEVNPELEMAEITRRVFEANGPALLFENVKNSPFPAVSNLLGTWERTQMIFEPELERVKALVELRSDPSQLFKSPKKGFQALKALIHALPMKTGTAPVLANRTRIEYLPMIKCWPKDGGAFVLLPQVFSRDPENSSVLNSNLGMYRIQISGGDYEKNCEVGLHYQIHRGIGNHHKKALEQNKPLKVTIFIGGPLAHTLAAVMPLPEGLPEVAFAGALSGRNFRYCLKNGFTLSADADFCITGTIVPHKTKIEGPFGDHLGYYSNAHPYPYLKVENVWHRKDAVYPFTVVGRTPQEDTNFGKLIHEITRSAVQDTIPGVVAVNAVDDAGVHPLCLAVAHERYVPYEPRAPRELLTHANAILGTNQLSLAKYLFICAYEDNPRLNVNDEKAFFIHLLERIDFSSDLHFLTRTTMDTLDYSTRRINQGSKLIMAAAGEKRRQLNSQFPGNFSLPNEFKNPKILAPGMVVVEGPLFTSYDNAKGQMKKLADHLYPQKGLEKLPLFVVVDDAGFTAASFANFLWVTFLRSNPSHDIYGANEKIRFKHWGCNPPLIIDAREKPFHADQLIPDKKTARKVDEMGKKGGELFNII